MREKLPAGARRLARKGLNGFDRAISAAGERSTRRLQPLFPHAIRLEYPPTSDLRPRYGHTLPPHPRLARIMAEGHDRYDSWLSSFVEFFDEMAAIDLRGDTSSEPCWLNAWLIGADTVSLYGFVRRLAPARYVEVGSGQSTKVVARAKRDGGLVTNITSIDPHPRSEVDALCDRIVRRPLEGADLSDCFGALEAGDMVFFDGSHRLFPNSDCVAFYLDVLPSLPPGVFVGIHDIFLPDDYPAPFLQYWWSEQYLLASLLLAEAPWIRVALPTWYATAQPEMADRLAPLFDRLALPEANRRGSAIWLETTPSGRAPAPQ